MFSSNKKAFELQSNDFDLNVEKSKQIRLLRYILILKKFVLPEYFILNLRSLDIMSMATGIHFFISKLSRLHDQIILK